MNLDDVFESLEPIQLDEPDDDGPGDITTLSDALRKLISLGDKVGKSDFRTKQVAATMSTRLDRLEEQLGEQLQAREQDLREARRQVGQLEEESSRLVVGMIQIADLVESAIRAAETEADVETYEDLERLGREIRKVLNRLGLEPLARPGEPQNPEFHEVVGETADSEESRGTIIELIRQGYRYAGQVQRIAKVIVAS